MIIQAGDTLIVTTAGNLSPEQAEKVKEAFIAEFPGLEAVVVATGITAIAAYRPNAREIEES